MFLDYAFRAECPEEELLERLRRLRGRLKELPFRSVDTVRRVDPAYNPVPLKMLQRQGHPLPPAVAKRLEGKLGTTHDELCLYAAPPGFMCVPRKLEHRFIRPAVEFARTTDLWREDDLPAEVGNFSLTYSRAGIALELANVMLRHGYVMFVDPGEGCESFVIGLTSYRTVEPPLWLGDGFTKTQYAAQFVQCHESICRALDLVKDEGLLLAARDTCGFYRHRDWSKSADIVNKETTFAQLVGGMVDAGIKAAQERGAAVEDISDPATKNYNLVRVEEEARQGKKGSPGE